MTKPRPSPHNQNSQAQSANTNKPLRGSKLWKKHFRKRLRRRRRQFRFRNKGPIYPRFIDCEMRLTWVLTRHCLDKAFRLPPGDPTRTLFEYFLAWAAKQNRVTINAVVVMNNHYHVIVSVTDWKSNISGFMHCLNLNTAKVLNYRQRRSGPLYEVKPFDMVGLSSEEDILRAMAFIVYKPVDAGLVKEPEDWPGLVSTFETYSQEREPVDRPENFGKKSTKPKQLTLKFERPPIFNDRTEQEFLALLKQYGDQYRDEIHEYHEQSDEDFVGLEAILNQSVNDRPNPEDLNQPPFAEEEAKEQENEDTPNSSNQTKDSKKRDPYDQKHEAFLERYAECMEKVKAGERPTFPYPTLKMVKTYGFPAEPRTSTAATPILHHFPHHTLE